MDLTSTKVLAVGLLWIATIVFGYLLLAISKLLKWRARRRGEEEAGECTSSKIVDRLNFVAGGVFLATIFLDLLPEATDTLDKAMERKGFKPNIPMTPLIMAIGMLAFMHFEHLTLILKDCHWTGRGHGLMKAIAGPPEGEVELYSIGDMRKVDPEFRTSRKKLGPAENPVAYYDTVSVDAISLEGEPESGFLLKPNEEAIDRGHFKMSGEFHPSRPIIEDELDIGTISESEMSHGCHHKIVNTPLRSYILVIALSLHSVFDGIVIGLSDNVTDVWTLFTAVVVHKSLVSVSLGSKLLTMGHCISKRTIFFLILTFTFTTPIGGTIGILMARSAAKNDDSGLAEGILISMATGTFTYVTFFEMLKFEGDNMSNLVNTVLVTIGFAVTATVMSFETKHSSSLASGDISRP